MKQKVKYACQSCGYSSSKWLGRCPSCNSWNTLVEERVEVQKEGSLSKLREDFRDVMPNADGKQTGRVVPLSGEEEGDSAPRVRFRTGIGELDRVLGGGMVPDGFTLLGGDPGIGKSTLLLQMANGLVQSGGDHQILYVSGEESIDQIRSRALRLGIDGKKAGAHKIFLAAETQLERVFALVQERRPTLLLVDSLQTFSTDFLDGAPGSVGQVREVAARLMTLAKSTGIAVWIVGHVTKEGQIAGPKVVEHIVDTVLYFEGDSSHSYRLLRTVKNRFGSAQELGVFEMTGSGLMEVKNPSSLFLEERDEALPGVAVACTIEGTRPILVEIQALVSSSQLSFPRRTSVGMDGAKTALLSAIIEKQMGIEMSSHDLYLNVAGGYRLSETACDLAACAAIASSARSKAVPMGVAWIGEVGLTGEVRRVPQADIRAEEARKLGFHTLVVPKGLESKLSRMENMKIIPVSKLREISLMLE